MNGTNSPPVPPTLPSGRRPKHEIEDNFDLAESMNDDELRLLAEAAAAQWQDQEGVDDEPSHPGDDS